MSFLFNLFKSTKVECPRCLGKGEVDLNDLKRLQKELKWIPGNCAYCLGKGKVRSKMISRVPADMTYLTLELPPLERNRLINGDENALLRAKVYDTQTNEFIEQMRYLNSKGNMDPTSIAEFYRIGDAKLRNEEKAMRELVEYIERIFSKVD